MMWLFSRRKEEIRLETWYDKHTSEFVVDVAHPNGQRDSKRFLNQAVFRNWFDTWGRQLGAQGWTQSGPFLFAPEHHPIQSLAPPVTGGDGTHAAGDHATRTYRSGPREFEVLLSRLVLKNVSMWTVERVTETRRGSRRVSIPGMHAVASPSPDGTFARACDCIDKWLLANPRA